MDSTPADERLKSIADELRAGNQPPIPTVRELVSWFGVQRRGNWIVKRIRKALKKAGLLTEPDFESVYIDTTIQFALRKIISERENPSSPDEPVVRTIETAGAQVADAIPEASIASSKSEEVVLAYNDPTFTIGRLEAANKPIRAVAPDASIREAVTIMLGNDYTQLPVMTTPREVKGIVTWQSMCVTLAFGRKADVVRDVMEPHHELQSTASIFQAIPIIAQKNYVIVRGPDGRICGIVTASDLSYQFRQHSEPFLLLGEIENHIRGIIDNSFSGPELLCVRDPGDTTKSIEDASDLNFGGYIRLLQDQDRWIKVAIPLDRVTFCKQLDDVRKIRNDVMHFDPDGIPPEDIGALRDFVSLLQRLRR